MFLYKEKVLQILQNRKRKVESFYAMFNMFEMPIEKKEYAQSHIPLKGNIVPITHTISTYKRTHDRLWNYFSSYFRS